MSPAPPCRQSPGEIPGPRPLDTWCDATAALAEQAMVRVTKGPRVLEFCVYHWRKHALALMASGWAVDRDR